MADLIHADTEQQRKLAIKQMEGGLFKQFDKWRNQVIKVMANIEAYIDFAESEDIEDTVPNEVKTQVTDILRLVKNTNKFLNLYIYDTGTPPLTRFFEPGKNRVKGKLRYSRSILVLKPQNGEFESSKSTFLRFSLDSFIYFFPSF